MGDYTTVDGEIADGRTAGDPPSRLDRVFVGIPDVLTREQFARLNGLACAEKAMTYRLGKEFEPDEVVARFIEAADKFTAYILNGPSS